MDAELVTQKRIQHARKAHRCETCAGLAADVGGAYRRDTYVYDGRLYDWVQCENCRAMTDQVWQWSTADDSIDRDDYREWAEEHADHGTPAQQTMARAYLQRLHAATA